MGSKLDYFVTKLYGKYVISVILGLGLASIFRRVCKERNCLIFKAPSFKEIKGNIYKYGDKCYKFKEHAVPCKKGEIVEF